MAIGLPLMWIAAKSSPKLFRAAAYPLVIVSVVGLVPVLSVGRTVDGAERWIQVAGFQIQPSEFAKLGFLLWGADLLARKEKLGQLTDWRHLLIPLLPGAAILGMLVMLGDDLGTTFLLLVIFLSLLWVIGTPGRLFIGMLGLLVFVDGHPDHRGAVPARADHRLPEPAGPALVGGLAVDPGQVRGRLRRPVRRRPRRQQAEVGLGARTPPPTSSSRSSARNSA